MNNNKIFVAGLPFTSSEDDLRSFFDQAGTITSVSIITDRETNRSKGFGFIEYEKAEEAQKAIEMFNGSDMGGRRLVVALAKPMERRERPSSGNWGGRSFGGRGGGRNDRRGGDRGGFSRGGGRGGFRGGR